MNFQPLEQIANAVMYEGFLLYPYRKSSVKNQQRWHFGTIDADHQLMQTECLIEGGEQTAVSIRVRFLQDETEHQIDVNGLSLAAARIEEGVAIESHLVAPQLFRLTVRITNVTPNPMLSTHTLLGVENGAFLSLMDPPEQYVKAAKDCKNIGTWPVLAGAEGEHRFMFSSPIILYDYPQIAPESAGDLFDGTEIDEILTLRVLTLSEEERREVREGDERARNILERTESMPSEALAKMHGAIRGLRNASKLSFRKGDRVRLHPSKKADIFDIALNGKVAVIESVERDFEDKIHLAVTVEDDPGREFGEMRQIGHRFFFGPEEVELL